MRRIFRATASICLLLLVTLTGCILDDLGRVGAQRADEAGRAADDAARATDEAARTAKEARRAEAEAFATNRLAPYRAKWDSESAEALKDWACAIEGFVPDRDKFMSELAKVGGSQEFSDDVRTLAIVLHQDKTATLAIAREGYGLLCK